MNGINLKSLGISKISALNENNDLNSEDGIVKEYKRLSIQLKQLQILKKRTSDQIQSLRQEDIETKDLIQKYGNLEVKYCISIYYKHFFIRI